MSEGQMTVPREPKKPSPTPKVMWFVNVMGYYHGCYVLREKDHRGIVRGSDLAHAWMSGGWCTWDENGTGGENSIAVTFEEAKRAAIKALIRQQENPIKGWSKHSQRITRALKDALVWG